VEDQVVLADAMVIHLSVLVAVKSAINVQKMIASVVVILVIYAVVAQNVEKMVALVVVMEIQQNVYVA